MKGGESNSGAKQTHKMLSVKKCSVKAFKESNRPKGPRKPPTDFFLFVDEFCGKFLEKPTNHKARATDVYKAATVEWETLSDADKAPYVEEAKKRRAEYLKGLKEFEESMYAYGAKKDAIKAKAKAVAEELGANLTGLIIRQ